MAADALAIESVPAKSRVPASAFFWALALVTAAPLFWLGFGIKLFHESPIALAPALVPIILVTSIGHVGTTAFF
jgi:hypothetical protein